MIRDGSTAAAMVAPTVANRPGQRKLASAQDAFILLLTLLNVVVS